ncbi:MAG: nuclear transport factor 2 family protein [Nocardioides sp.]|uniref:nuclear transport factor 2 family protein n=1 Tax=Nocardioides sp. TaxID=35761 RepID=UPI003F0FC0A9
MPGREQIVEACESYVAAVGRGDVEAVMALFAVDARQEDPVGSEPNVGADAIRAFFEASAQVPMRTTRYGPVTVTGNRAVFQLVVSLDSGDGGTFQMLFSDVVTFGEDGRITEILGFPDGEAQLDDAPGARAALVV